MNKKRKNQLLLTLVLVLCIAVGIVGAVLSPAAMAIPAPTVTPAAPERPQPPTIETWGIPDPAGGEPAECAGQAGCGVMCFYVSEDAAANQYELSCVAWVFE